MNGIKEKELKEPNWMERDSFVSGRGLVNSV